MLKCLCKVLGRVCCNDCVGGEILHFLLAVKA